MKFIRQAALAVMALTTLVFSAPSYSHAESALEKRGRQASPRGVFAHFMVGNTEFLNQGDWESNMKKAAAAGIHGFVLNMAQDWGHNEASVAMAFSAASATGFKLLFSFDYAGGGPWPKQKVM